MALKGDKAAKSAQLLIASMNPHDLDYLLSTLENRTEGSRIFLKFSKFKAFYGQKELVDRGDAIKVILSFSGYFKGLPPKSILSKVGLIPN
ncbi:hypothetical protein B9Q13_04990 [Candidatus Marsarchaeota G2 archaeon ECH_B_SAG-G16]|uniref:Uncharacterized protein n=1 Tax=Candidatus Marsarchaeota G2 archaeon ECH_B_SAG-G16 TaxID=1978167 RepID=A0A2R6C0E1_9ARCH|nr:MAG: hypothetical protein B9Q13_04990 [Candidatus Marsarchaeota G2 archaeon ECH_B_SAG-G16]